MLGSTWRLGAEGSPEGHSVVVKATEIEGTFRLCAQRVAPEVAQYADPLIDGFCAPIVRTLLHTGSAHPQCGRNKCPPVRCGLKRFDPYARAVEDRLTTAADSR